MPAATGIDYVLDKLRWMRAEHIWPNGLRYLWTDAFGVVLLVSLYRALAKDAFLDEAEWLVAQVDRVLGRPRGIRIGEEPDRDGQYFHYLAMWLYALAVIGRHIPRYREKGIDLVHQVHDAFLLPGRGVIWKMKEDLSSPYPGYGLGALDAFDGYVSYRMLDEQALSREIADVRKLIDRSAPGLVITQDLGTRHDVVDDPVFSRRTMGATSKKSLPRHARSHVAARGVFLPGAGSSAHQIRLHQLRSVHWLTGGRRHAGARRAAQRVFRELAFRR